MRSKLPVSAALILVMVAACAPEPPLYESRYTPPPPVTRPPPPLPPGSSFIDDFNRPDTSLGLDAGWDIRKAEEGNPEPPLATDGFISGGHYASAGLESVYAARTFRSTVRRVGAEARWTRIGDGSVETLVMAITANGQLMGDQVQLAAHPIGWVVSTRRNGQYRRVFRGVFDPPLDLDREYRFEMDAADESVTVRIPGAERKANVGMLGLLSERAFWRYAFAPADRPIGVKVSANMVWVAEDGQSMTPLPED